MRLWPLEIIDQLPRQQLLGQHRECCALRGKGWGKKHATVDYVFKHPYYWLWMYHLHVMDEMRKRGYNFDRIWFDVNYRGKRIGYDNSYFASLNMEDRLAIRNRIYPEHDEKYLQECIENLARKGVSVERKGNAS